MDLLLVRFVVNRAVSLSVLTYDVFSFLVVVPFALCDVDIANHRVLDNFASTKYVLLITHPLDKSRTPPCRPIMIAELSAHWRAVL